MITSALFKLQEKGDLLESIAAYHGSSALEHGRGSRPRPAAGLAIELRSVQLCGIGHVLLLDGRFSLAHEVEAVKIGGGSVPVLEVIPRRVATQLPKQRGVQRRRKMDPGEVASSWAPP